MTRLDWEAIKEKYPIGRKVDAIVVKVWRLGVQVQLDEDGTQGVIRNHELSWDYAVADATTFSFQGRPLAPGRAVKVVVLRLDGRKREPVLSLRHAVYDPWEHQGSRFGVATRVRGRVISITRDSAYVEFDDHVKARLPRDEIVPWPIDDIDKILRQGDTVEAIVIARDEAAREIVISMKARLQEIAEELARPGEGNVVVPSAESTPARTIGETPKPAVDTTSRKIERILIADDQEQDAFLLEDSLNDLGYENVETKTSFPETVAASFKTPYDLILLDIKEPNDGRAGLRAAETIMRERPDSLIVLVTGESGEGGGESIRKGQELGLAGMLLKPVSTEDLKATMANLEQSRYAGWPERLPPGSQEAVEFVQSISRAVVARRPLQEVLDGILSKIAAASGANKAAIFSLDPLTGRVDLRAGIGIAAEDVDRVRHLLPKSPVNDVIFRGERISTGDTYFNEGKYRNLRRLTEFRSCIGVPVEGASDGLGYGLFLLHPGRHHFTEKHLVRAEAAAAIAGQAIREQWVIQQVAADQRLTLLGTTIASVGHELRSRANALEAAPRLLEAWEQIKADPRRLANAAYVQRVDRYVEILTSARRGMGELTDLLLGSVSQTSEQNADVHACLQTALRMMGHLASREQVDLVYKPDGIVPVSGNALELEQVFMNILLNAIQQMPRSGRRRGRVTVDVRYCPGEPSLPVKIRFSDTGPGIHAEHLEKIFEPMFTTKPKGTGMGLYISQELSGLMGGRIRVEDSAILVGTTFLVELPASKT